MAELFGIVAAALSVAGLFNNAIDLFEYVQLGRHFEEDYQTWRLRLDVARLRLSRWGAVVRVDDDPRFAEVHPAEEEVRIAKRILEHLVNLFSISYTQSASFGPSGRDGGRVPVEPLTSTNDMHELRSTLQALSRRHRKKHSLSNKVSWTLYKRKHLSRLLDDIQELLDSLEATFPQQNDYQQFVKAEIDEIKDEASLRALSAAAAHTDVTLSLAAIAKLENAGGDNNTIGKAVISESAYLRIGSHSILEDVAILRGMAVTCNRIAILEATGNSTTVVGNVYTHFQGVNLQ